MQTLHQKLVIYQKWTCDITQTAIRLSTETIDWMVAAQSIRSHSISCISDSTLEVLAFRSVRSADEVSLPTNRNLCMSHSRANARWQSLRYLGNVGQKKLNINTSFINCNELQIKFKLIFHSTGF